jgi:hypothetical protein
MKAMGCVERDDVVVGFNKLFAPHIPANQKEGVHAHL